jgi:hypothetical protein
VSLLPGAPPQNVIRVLDDLVNKMSVTEQGDTLAVFNACKPPDNSAILRCRHRSVLVAMS